MESLGTYVDDWVSPVHFFLVPVFVPTALPRFHDFYHLERCVMPSHDAVLVKY